MTEELDLDGSFTFLRTSMTVKRMGFGAMQLAGKDGDKLAWDRRATFPVPSLFCAKP